ncbi:TonB family protein [Labrys sp. ZIDIC5]|uniref:energy transducer TonB family protein n=1 Tax=Labrys sedimenti TaxID=3106036 RepID=UPI002ACA7A83|nr:TonB family protein [Labrys sp. ZIDIC5]MDZ5452239.1 TonB family protein [Labrys sp. ZIDIC5]
MPSSRLAGRPSSLSSVGLWASAAAVMLLVHGAGIWVARDWHPIGPPPAGNPEPAIEFDLAPPTTLPEAPPQEAVKEIVPDQAQDTPADTVQPVEPEPVQPQTQEVEPTPVEPQQVPEQTPPEPEPVQPDTPPEPPPEVVPDLPTKDKAEVILPAAPKPQPKPKKKPAPRKEPERQRPVVQPRPTVVAPRQQAVQPTAPRLSGTATGDELAAWRRAVGARVQRAASSMSVSGKGTVRVAFSVSASGQVSSPRLVGSSGNPSLDASGINAARRLGSLPPPPGGAKAITVPIIFK